MVTSKHVLDKICAVLIKFHISSKLHFFISDPCAKLTCDYNGLCNRRLDGSAECICQICDFDPNTKAVCGSDGISYASYCHLKSASCKKKEKIAALKFESCGKKCSTYLLLNFLIWFHIRRWDSQFDTGEYAFSSSCTNLFSLSILFTHSFKFLMFFLHSLKF